MFRFWSLYKKSHEIIGRLFKWKININITRTPTWYNLKLNALKFKWKQFDIVSHSHAKWHFVFANWWDMHCHIAQLICVYFFWLQSIQNVYFQSDQIECENKIYLNEFRHYTTQHKTYIIYTFNNNNEFVNPVQLIKTCFNKKTEFVFMQTFHDWNVFYTQFLSTKLIVVFFTNEL